MAPTVDFLQSKAFATFEGVVNTFINSLEQVQPAMIVVDVAVEGAAVDVDVAVIFGEFSNVIV